MKDRPPLVQLLVRATLWTPAAFAITVILVVSWGATIILPLLAALSFYSSDFIYGFIYLGLCIPAFVLARYLTKHFWEEPPSLL